MIHRVIAEVVRELNEHVTTLLPGSRRARVVASSFADSSGAPRQGVRERIIVQVVNVDEQALVRAREPGRSSPARAPLGLIVLFAAHFDDHLMALQALSLVVEFLRDRPVMAVEEAGRARFELYPMTLEQQSGLWATLGASYMP